MTYKIKKENNARSRSKVVHFNNLKPLKKLRRPTNKDDIHETPEEEPAASDSEHELITVTVPNTEDDLNPDKPLEQEEQGHQLPDVSVQDIETSGMENMEGDSDEESVPDSPTQNQRPIRQRRAPSWFGDYVMNVLKAAKKTLTRR